MTDGMVYFAFFPNGFIKKEFGVNVLFNYRVGNVNNTANFIKEKNVEFSKFAPKNDGTGDAIFSDLNGYKFYLDTAPNEERVDVPDS